MIFNIIEPTLNDYTGHCYSLVKTIVQAVPTLDICIWAGRHSGAFWKNKGQIKPYFFRPLRKIQSYILYHRLLKSHGKILVSTAGTFDLVMINWAAHGLIPPNKVYFYIHWLGCKTSKSDILAQIAKKQPHVEILCTTESVTAFFRGLGFRASTVAYPCTLGDTAIQPSRTFKHLLVAGAARMDKGIDRIADLVEHLALTHAQWPLWVQTSAGHQAQHGAKVGFELNRITQSGYGPLTLLSQTLAPPDYRALFAGGISLQPYSLLDFEDRVSGVTLDALTAGCPVIVTANTWSGRAVMQHDAGVVCDDVSPSVLQQAISHILSDYEGYAARAAQAGRTILHTHSAASMMDVIFERKT